MLRMTARSAIAALVWLSAGAAVAADPTGPEAASPKGESPEVLGGALYDQTDDAAGLGIASQRFEAAFSAFTCRGADDFTVPVDAPRWNIDAVQLPGFYVNAPASTPPVAVAFLSDAGGTPGAEACSRTAVATDLGGGTLLVPLDPPCDLPAGTYWLSAQAQLDFGAGNSQWFWGERTTATGAEATWENPGDGFGWGCTTFTPMTGCGAGNPSLLFALLGAPVPVELLSFDIE